MYHRQRIRNRRPLPFNGGNCHPPAKTLDNAFGNVEPHTGPIGIVGSCIGFTAAFYSLGVPPELIATGRALKIAREQKLLPLIEKYYPALKDDLHHAGKYFNRENLELLARRYTAFEGIQEGIGLIEEIMGLKLGPEKPHHIIHRNITSTIFHRLHGEKAGEDLTHDIVEAGMIRRSLG